MGSNLGLAPKAELSAEVCVKLRSLPHPPPPMRIHNKKKSLKNITINKKPAEEDASLLFKVEKDEFQPPALKSKSIWYGQLKDGTSTCTAGSSVEDQYSINPYFVPGFFVECGSGFYDQKIEQFLVGKNSYYFDRKLQYIFTPPVLSENIESKLRNTGTYL
jgi:hypothetical protein